MPLVAVLGEVHHRVVDLLEGGVFLRDFAMQRHGFLVAGLHDRRREGVQLHAVGEQAAQRRRIQLVVLRHARRVGVGARLLKDRLIVLRQRVVFIQVEEGEQHRAAFPPSRIVIVRRDLVEAEFFIVVRADPFGRVDGAFFESRVDVRRADLLRHDTETLQDAAGETADPELETLEVVDGVDFLAEPAAHLTAGVAGEDRGGVVLLVEFIENFGAAAVRPPALVQPGIRAETDRGAESEGRVLAEIVVRGGVAALDGAVLHGVDDLQRGDDFAGSEYLDLKFAVGRFADRLRHRLGGAVKRFQRLRPAAGHTPLDLGRRLRDRRRGNRRRGDSEAGGLNKLTTFHSDILPCDDFIAGAPSHLPRTRDSHAGTWQRP